MSAEIVTFEVRSERPEGVAGRDQIATIDEAIKFAFVLYVDGLRAYLSIWCGDEEVLSHAEIIERFHAKPIGLTEKEPVMGMFDKTFEYTAAWWQNRAEGYLNEDQRDGYDDDIVEEMEALHGRIFDETASYSDDDRIEITLSDGEQLLLAMDELE